MKHEDYSLMIRQNTEEYEHLQMLSSGNRKIRRQRLKMIDEFRPRASREFKRALRNHKRETERKRIGREDRRTANLKRLGTSLACRDARLNRFSNRWMPGEKEQSEQGG